MHKDILGRNLLIGAQIRELASAFQSANVPVILLKGAALVEILPKYAFERTMDDIDLLLRPENMARALRLLAARGYAPLPEDPCALARPGGTVPVDLCDNLWYCTAEENRRIFERAVRYPIADVSPLAFHLAPEDFYIHVAAHAAVHHAHRKDSWLRDMRALREKWKGVLSEDVVEERLRDYGLLTAVSLYEGKTPAARTVQERLYLRLLKSGHPDSGHITRFIFLPLRLKMRYLLSALFPPREFLVKRYSLGSRGDAFLYRFLRPFLLMKKLFSYLVQRGISNSPDPL